MSYVMPLAVIFGCFSMLVGYVNEMHLGHESYKIFDRELVSSLNFAMTLALWTPEAMSFGIENHAAVLKVIHVPSYKSFV